MKTFDRLLSKTFIAGMACAVLGLGASSAQAATVYFLKIGDIKGESTDPAHKDWIDISSFSWGVSNSGTIGGVGGGGSVGKVVFTPFSWTQNLDASVPSLYLGVASGKHIPTATMDVQKAGAGGKPSVFFQMKFDDVILNSLSLSGAGDNPFVAASLQFAKLTMTYRPMDAKGVLGPAVVGGWDLTKDSASAFFGSADVLQGLLLAGPTPNPVPVPAAVWLFASGLLGLIGVARRSTRRTGG